MKLSISFFCKSNLKLMPLYLISCILKFILLISFKIFSIIMQLFIKLLNILSSFHLLFNVSSPFSIEILILLGIFSHFLIKFSSNKVLSYCLSISENSCSSFSFNLFLILVNKFCISNFKFSLSLFISLTIFYNSIIGLIFLDNFFKNDKFLFKFSFF